MDRKAIKDFTYGGLLELMRNRQYYYHSGVGSGYNHFTAEGERALIEYMNIVAAQMIESEEEELNERSKQLVLKGLKGDQH
jgi:hypothetical protein